MFVKMNDGSDVNVGSIAKLTPTKDPKKLGWPDWVAGVVMLASGKEFGIDEEDYEKLELSLPRQPAAGQEE